MSALSPLPQASSYAPAVDHLFDAMLLLCGGVALGVFAAMFVFCIRYRRGHAADREGGRTRMGVELAWTLVPFALFVGIFGWSVGLWAKLRTPPADSVPVYIVAKQWMWRVQHPDGTREIDTLHVPLGQPVRLVMISQDVVHSFYVPAFRVKQDVLPGRYTELWFTATRAGRFPMFCSEYCGTGHPSMRGTVVAMAPADYARWLHAQPSLGLAARGAQLFRSLGCSGCHDPDSGVHAPDLRGLYGAPVPLSDGSMARADDRYLHDSIVLPRSQVAAGYAPIMPSYQGRIGEEDILALIAYVKSLRVQGGQGHADP